MSIKTWIRSWAKSRNEQYLTLADILSNPDNRESMLGVQRAMNPSPEMQKADADKVIHYSVSSEYKIWAEEAWVQVINCIDELTDPDLSATEVDFYRGALKQTFELLRISYKARSMKEQINHIMKNGV